jgi:putative transposase
LKQKPYQNNHFLSSGYCVDTVGLDSKKIRKDIKYQEKKERLLETNLSSTNQIRPVVAETDS